MCICCCCSCGWISRPTCPIELLLYSCSVFLLDASVWNDFIESAIVFEMLQHNIIATAIIIMTPPPIAAAKRQCIIPPFFIAYLNAISVEGGCDFFYFFSFGVGEVGHSRKIFCVKSSVWVCAEVSLTSILSIIFHWMSQVLKDLSILLEDLFFHLTMAS